MFDILVNKILVVCPGHLAVVLIGADIVYQLSSRRIASSCHAQRIPA